MSIRCPFCDGAAIVFSKTGAAPCIKCSGTGWHTPPAKRYRIAIVGEAFGSDEAAIGLPFVGYAGQTLNAMLEEAEIERSECYVTNVFNLQPKPTNDVKNLGCPKAESRVPMPAFTKDTYLRDEYWPEVLRLYKELAEVKPNIVIALGNTPLWALTGNFGITKVRGTTLRATYGGAGVTGLKVLPTYHPSYINRAWQHRAVAIADLMKAKRQSLFPEIRRPAREIWTEPSIAHIKLFYETYVLKNCTAMAADIETAGADQITCVGFAPSIDRALVIPFVDNRKENGSYWPTPELEAEAWSWVARFMQHPELGEIRLVGQNFLYDINWLWTFLGITPRNFTDDTMLKSHAINPEMEKSLGFLASIQTDEPAWKTMRGKGLFTIKRGE